jgi:hypothetical protein
VGDCLRRRGNQIGAWLIGHDPGSAVRINQPVLQRRHDAEQRDGNLGGVAGRELGQP